MKPNLREYLRPAARDFVQQTIDGTGDKAYFVLMEAIEAIKEEARALGVNEPTGLPPLERQRLIMNLVATEMSYPCQIIDSDRRQFWSLYEDALLKHLPYNGMTDTAIRALAEFNGFKVTTA